ncbi:hypothetical protein QL285_053493 [Trifolium repens]|nr:hypothetical protein QL285_053493 [Trifolium repens]
MSNFMFITPYPYPPSPPSNTYTPYSTSPQSPPNIHPSSFNPYYASTVPTLPPTPNPKFPSYPHHLHQPSYHTPPSFNHPSYTPNQVTNTSHALGYEPYNYDCFQHNPNHSSSPYGHKYQANYYQQQIHHPSQPVATFQNPETNSNLMSIFSEINEKYNKFFSEIDEKYKQKEEESRRLFHEKLQQISDKYRILKNSRQKIIVEENSVNEDEKQDTAIQ